MTTNVVTRPVRDVDLVTAVAALLVAPTSVTVASDSVTIVFTPDLTAAQQVTFDRLVTYCRLPLAISASEYLVIAGQVDTLRAFRQQTATDFIAKTATQRDRDLFDATSALITVLFRTVIRD